MQTEWSLTIGAYGELLFNNAMYNYSPDMSIRTGLGDMQKQNDKLIHEYLDMGNELVEQVT